METLAPAANVKSKLSEFLTRESREVLAVASDIAKEQGCALYVAGGFVRNLILGLRSSDVDLVVEGDAIAIGKALEDRFGGTVIVHRKFLSAKWDLPATLGDSTGLRTIDLVTARSEYYQRPSSFPEVKPTSLIVDLKRRDFTINALAICLTDHRFGELYDYYGGLDDIRLGNVRVLHSESFMDDATRMVRAVRLEQRLGFALTPNTAELIHRALPLLGKMSGDRIRNELDVVFREPVPERILKRLRELGILRAIAPSLEEYEQDWVTVRFERARAVVPPSVLIDMYFGIWLYQMSAGAVTRICRRLNMGRGFADVIRDAVKLSNRELDIVGYERPSELASLFDGKSDSELQLMALAAKRDGLRDIVDIYLREIREVTPITTGNDLRRAGLKPGPHYKEVLNKLRYAWLDGEINSAEEEKIFLQILLSHKA